MDDIDTLLTAITKKVAESNLSDEEKADVYAQLATGMRHLVWPIILSHVPKAMLANIKNMKEMTANEYIHIIGASIRDPNTPKEVYNELKAALIEVQELMEERL